MAESAPTADEASRREHVTKAVASFRQMEPLTDRLLRWLPEWVRDVAQDRRRQLLYWERQVQRRLLNEYRAQARELDPLLRARGRLVGESLLQVFVGGGGNGGGKGLSYADAVANSFPDNVTNKLPVRELLAAVDPLITPFVAPVIEGIKQPIYLKLEEVEKQVVSSFVITAASCLVGGFLLGRLSRGGGSGSGGDGSSGGKGRGRR